MFSSFKTRRALVTGGTSGLGRSIALGLAELGCSVRVTGLTSAEVAQFRATENVTASQLNLSDAEAIRQLASELSALDILVNCAGMILREGREFQPEAFAEVIDVNLNGTMRICAACKPLLQQRQGCVLNIASMLSFFGSGSVPAYSASKGGIAQLTKSLAIAWATEGIRVNAIAPGWIKTPLTKALYENETTRRTIVERTPLKRWGEPNDVIGAALFLCSPAAAFITGAILPVDGGYSAM
jgi:NAD(P)-dependent dehydrogenase (short-subunit alcohol dehydrogenase family)